MKRYDIEQHPDYPFCDFRRNAESFILLQSYWSAVVCEALGETLSAKKVPLAQADQDPEGFGSPTLVHFWIPALGRGMRILHNDPPDDPSSSVKKRSEKNEKTVHSPLFIAAQVSERPEDWPFPHLGQLSGSVVKIEELVCIVDVDPAVADEVQQAVVSFFNSGVALDEMRRLCTEIERAWIKR